MSVLIGAELLFYVREEVNQELRQSLGRVSHCPFAKAFMNKDSSHDLTVDGEQLFRSRVVHVANSHISGESSGNFMAANGSGGVHRGHDLDSFKGHKF